MPDDVIQEESKEDFHSEMTKGETQKLNFLSNNSNGVSPTNGGVRLHMLESTGKQKFGSEVNSLRKQGKYIIKQNDIFSDDDDINTGINEENSVGESEEFRPSQLSQ